MLANKITIVRIILIPFFIAALINYSPDRDYLRLVALVIFCLGALSDFLDGYFARRLKQETVTGRILDAVADKIFLLSALILVSFFSILPLKLPAWIVIIIISRDMMVILGVLFLYIKSKKLQVFPNILGKIFVAFEVVSILSVLLLLKVSIIWYLTVILALLSGVGYLISALKVIKEETI